MALPPGTRLGPYDIAAAIGEGGMGEVYTARDTRLERTVAIKVLPSHASSDADARARFEREARAIAALDHPHICAIYDVGSDGGVEYLVMQYLEGETLASRLQKGPLPIELAIRYGAEIADALDTAHRLGIVHRDLKPANVMLTKSGARLLDFGLARLQPAVAPISGFSAVATEAPSLTAAGTILGTLQYMAPEQLEGGEADSRTDIFALGCVLYEMATGNKAFTGKSQASVISAIMGAQPAPMATLQPMTPAALDHVVAVCLAKDPGERWQSARDIERELKWVQERIGSPETAALAAQPKTRAVLWMAAGALLLAAAGIAGGLAVIGRRQVPAAPMRLSMVLPDTEPHTSPGNREAVALSPDGTVLAYQTLVDSRSASLHVRPLSSFDSRELRDTAGASEPFFSPDGQWVGFLTGDGKLKKAAVSGAGVLPIADLPVGVGPFSIRVPLWMPDDTILLPANTGMLAVSASGGALRTMIPLDPQQDEVAFDTPTLLPDGHTLLFAVRGKAGGWAAARVVVHDLTSGARRVLLQGGIRPRYLPTGHLVFAAAADSLLAVSFDVSRRAVNGSPVPFLQGVITNMTFGIVQVSMSSNGVMAYVPAVTAEPGTLLWVDRTGATHPALTTQRNFYHPRLSPDGRRVVVDDQGDIWLGDLIRGTLERATAGAGRCEAPIWSPEGRQIAFACMVNEKRVTMVKAVDSVGAPQVFMEHGENAKFHHHLESWSPDGRLIAISAGSRDDLAVLRVADKPAVESLVHDQFDKTAPMFSPDGKWLAYSSDESGKAEVYVQSLTGSAARHRVSTDGGEEPAWNPTGRELFYRHADQMIAVPVTTTPALAIGAPRVLFEMHFRRSGWAERDYDVSPDGTRFLVISEDRPRAELAVVLNWTEELKRLAPAK